MPAAAFTQAQIVRAVEGAKKAGISIAALEVCPDGVIRIVQKIDKQSDPENGELPEPWDDD